LEFNFESILVAKKHECTTVVYGVTSQLTDIFFSNGLSNDFRIRPIKKKIEELGREGGD